MTPPGTYAGMSLIQVIDREFMPEWECLQWWWYPNGGSWLQIVPSGSVMSLGGRGSRIATSSEKSDFNSALTALRSGELAVHGMRADEIGSWSLAAPAKLPMVFWQLSSFQINRTPAMLGDVSSRRIIWFADPTVYVPSLQKRVTRADRAVEIDRVVSKHLAGGRKVPLKTFAAAMRSDLGVEEGTRGYSDKTFARAIERVKAGSGGKMYN